VIVDSDSGFGGYGAEVVHYLRDDFGSKSVALFPTFPSHVSGDQKTNNLVLLPTFVPHTQCPKCHLLFQLLGSINTDIFVTFCTLKDQNSD
jgi:hypothetical protein